MADVYGQFLRWLVTESAASTLTEGDAISTGCQSRLSGGGFLAIEVHNILGVVSLPKDACSADAEESTAGAVSTRSDLTSLPSLDDEHCIYRTVIKKLAGVATYLPMALIVSDMPSYTIFAPPLLISHTHLYPYVLGTDDGAAGNFRGYLFYNYVDIEGALAVEALEAFR